MDLLSAKFVMVALVALIVLGPDKLPAALRAAGRGMAQFRRLSAGMNAEVGKMLDHAELAEPLREFRAGVASVRQASTAWMGPLAGLAPSAPSASSASSATTASASGVLASGSPAGPAPVLPPPPGDN